MAPARDALLLLLLSMVLCSTHGNDRLSYEFYDKSCPGIELLVRETIAPLFVADPTAPAALLRLMFHDCQVQGCDASILINSNIGYSLDNMTREMASSKNFGIRGSKIIEQLKSVAETQCPGVVSCADLLVLAARDAVALSGGPAMKALLGRRDAHTSSLQLADARLPPPTLGVDGMLKMLSAMGMDAPESVAILGSHTIGVTHCVNILKQPGSSYEVPPMNLVGMGYQLFVKVSCGTASLRAAASSSFFTNDKTSLVFDNQYFRDTIVGRGLLRIDTEMTAHPITAPFVALFAIDQDEFFRHFASAFAKLSTSGVLTGDRGQVHNRCNGNGV